MSVYQQLDNQGTREVHMHVPRNNDHSIATIGIVRRFNSSQRRSVRPEHSPDAIAFAFLDMDVINPRRT